MMEPLPDDLGLGRDDLKRLGFEGKVGQILVVPRGDGPMLVAIGKGDADTVDAAGVRDAAAAFARAAEKHEHLVVPVAGHSNVSAAAASQAAIEGILLARYSYDPLRREPKRAPVTKITLVAPPDISDDVAAGAQRGRIMATATAIARDLANSPPAHLTATRMAEIATRLGADVGLGVEVFDRDALVEMGCGGLLGVNAGSTEPPRMVKLSYQPANANTDTPHLAVVAKGIMYDSGGISLKPSDAVHATMKNDMSGAGATLAAMWALPQLDCPTAVTGYLMCTDNMPSGSATKLGDVLTIRGGTTVEVLNTDAEGRLVLADGLVLATEQQPDAIVDIATLTGAALRALGPEIAGVFGNNQALVDQVLAASQSTDEPTWQLPLATRYRKDLDSDVADIANMGGPNGAAIHAALFLADFVDDVPWAHIDIAGPAQNDADKSWRTKGCTGFGARLLAELALTFAVPKS